MISKPKSFTNRLTRMQRVIRPSRFLKPRRSVLQTFYLLPHLFCLYILSINTAYASCNSEIHNAAKIAERIQREWPLRPILDSKTQYVQKIVNYLVLAIEVRMDSSHFDWPLNSWTISLVRDLSVNAYSIGDGKIYLTDGAFNFVDNEAELAAIIAHEIAHQLIGHFCEQDTHYKSHQIGSFVQVLDNDKEIEADALAVEILQNTYYPAHAMLAVVEKLPSLLDGSQQKQLRLDALKIQLQDVKAEPFSSSPEFLNIKQQ